MYDDNEVDVSSLRYALYARKSTDDPQRQLRSIPDQIDECLKFAKNLGLHVVGEPFIEKKSARESNQRPVFKELINAIKEGTYDGILAWNPDRLARNAQEGGLVIDMVDHGQIKDLKFVTHHFTPDANGKMLLGIAFVLSKQYSDKLSQDVTRGVRKSFKEGKTPIYKHGYYRDEYGIYRPDEETFELLKEAWMMRAVGKSLEDITDYLNQNNYYRVIKTTQSKQSMTKQKLSKFFRDSFYYGLLVQAGQTVDLREVYTDFIPMVTRDVFDKVQSLSLDRPLPYKSKTKTYYPLRQMVKCAYCEGNMVVGASSGNTERYLYYRCDNDDCERRSKGIKTSIRAKVVFDFIYKFLEDGLNFTEKEYKEYYQGLKIVGDNERELTRSEIEHYQAQKRHLQKEIKRIGLAIGKMMDNKTALQINTDELERLSRDKDKIETNIEKLRYKLTDEKEEELSQEEFLNLSKNAVMTVKAGDAIVKDTICRLIFLNFSLDGEKVASYQLKEPFDTLLKSRSVLLSRGGRI